MKYLLLIILKLMVFECFAQQNNNLDSSKWYKMDSLVCDIDSDNIQDCFIIYNNKIGKGAGYGHPTFLKISNSGKGNTYKRFDKVFVYPYYKIDSCGKNKFLIEQDGVKSDRNKYYMYFKYDLKTQEIYLIKTIVLEYIPRSKYDPVVQKRVKLEPIVNKVSLKNYTRFKKIEEIDFFELFKSEVPK